MGTSEQTSAGDVGVLVAGGVAETTKKAGLRERIQRLLEGYLLGPGRVTFA